MEVVLYNQQPGHNKEYHIEVARVGSEYAVIVKWGRIDSRLQAKVHYRTFDRMTAIRAARDQWALKESKGYERVSGNLEAPNAPMITYFENELNDMVSRRYATETVVREHPRRVEGGRTTVRRHTRRLINLRGETVRKTRATHSTLKDQEKMFGY